MVQPRRNWSFPIGLGVTLMIVLLAVWGPWLAPRDPLQVTDFIFVNGTLYGPPPIRKLPPFQTWDYPLGHDQVGRDVLSRLLWAVRPTLIVCVAVATVRLVVGTLLGLIAGWFGGWAARITDALTSLSLALPLLAIAIAVVVALGVARGLIAFVAALTITGWSETLVFVRSRTESVKNAAYIESAHAIGVGQRGILLRHVLPQVWPILPVLLAFELSAATLIIAELGYLGYFIGGTFAYSDPDEGVRISTATYPELGQMLSDVFGLLNTAPWVTLFAGGTMLMMLAGFALLGDGLRQRVDVTRPRRQNVWTKLLPRQRIRSATPTARRTQVGAGLAVAALIVVVAVVLLQRGSGTRTASTAASPTTTLLAVTTNPKTADQLAAIDLQALIFQPGDLPQNTEATRFAARPPYALRDLPPATQAATAGIDQNAINAGEVTVLLYARLAERDAAYAAATADTVPLTELVDVRGGPNADQLASSPPPVIGERSLLGGEALISPNGTRLFTGTKLTFARCGAVAVLELDVDSAVTIQYAQRLDARLAAQTCQPQGS